jgi:hypothetical protein
MAFLWRFVAATAVLLVGGNAQDSQQRRRIDWRSVGHKVTASSINQKFTPSRAVDGSSATYWESLKARPGWAPLEPPAKNFLPAAAKGQTWFRVQWALPVCVSGVEWVNYNSGYAPSSFVLWAATQPHEVCVQDGPMQKCTKTPWNPVFSDSKVMVMPGNTVVANLQKTVCSKDWAIAWNAPCQNKKWWPSIRELTFFEGGGDGEPTDKGWVR